MMKQVGMNVDYQAMDWGTVVQRRAKQDPAGQGRLERVPHRSGPGSTSPTRSATCSCAATARTAWWAGRRAEDRGTAHAWFEAPDLAAQKKIAVEIQLQALIDLPYVPLGQTFSPTCFTKDITGVLNGFVIFWNVRRT